MRHHRSSSVDANRICILHSFISSPPAPSKPHHIFPLPKKLFTDMTRPKIYLFGDSITEDSFAVGGWGASLAHQFSRTADVVLRGYSGYNTRWALKVLDRVFPASQGGDGGTETAPIALTVFFGANDACLPDRCSAFQHVPVHEYKQNLHSIVSFFKKRWPTTLILLITPPPIDEDARCRYPFVDNPQGLPERTNEAAGEYARACIAVAGECGIPVVDLWTKMQQFPDRKKDYLSITQNFTRVMMLSLLPWFFKFTSTVYLICTWLQLCHNCQFRGVCQEECHSLMGVV
ncbi:GDSL esterase/lipase [Spatholobus suberectus]|nr:GDSL esterase/lipase [Spatholobus suberectus]